MSSAFINNFASVRFGQNLKPKIANARFTLVNDSTVSVSKSGDKYHADISLTQDFELVGLNTEVNMVHEHSDFSGMNKRFVSEDGLFDTLAALEEFSRSGVERRLVKEDTFSILTKQTKTDSHVAFLYNMLVSWMKAETYKVGGHKDNIIKAKMSSYEDDHCKYDYKNCGDGRTVEILLGSPVTDDVYDEIDWDRRKTSNYWDRPYVLHYNGGARGQEDFYLLHVLGRNVKDNLNFVFDIPGLDTSELLLDGLNCRDALSLNPDAVPWDKPDTLWGWIMDYVSTNRLQQQFAASFEMLGALSYHPKWSTLEACVWNDAIVKVVLAHFAPTRARIRGTLEGEPYMPSSIPHEFIMREGSSPSSYVLHSAILNYLVWYGYYTIIENEARSRDEWRTAFGSIVDDLVVLTSPIARASAVSVITGNQMITNANHGCGVYIDASPLAGKTRMVGIEPKDDSVEQVMALNAVYAPVSGCLAAGALVEEFDTTQHLAPLQKIPGFETGIGHMSGRDTVRVSNMYRMFGHDTITCNAATGEEFSPWANWRECVIEPASVGFRPGQPDYYRIEGNSPRSGRNHTIPSHRVMLNSEGATFMIREPTIRMVEWRTRTKPVRHFTSIKSRKKVLRFFVKSGFEYHTDVFRARVVKPEDVSGFGQAEPSIAPEAPAMMEVAPSQNVSAGEGTSTAITAE